MSCGPEEKSYPSDCEVTEGLRKMARDNSSKPLVDAAVLARAEQIRLLLLDVDGVLTDGTLIFSQEGEESKGFNTQDGFGIRLLQEADIDVGVITARKSEAVTKRCQNLKMRYVYQGESNKINAYNDIVSNSGLKPYQIAYMGDDWLDMILLKKVGLAASPANAVDEVKKISHVITRKNGGHGAVRELCNLILQSKGLLEKLLQSYMSR